MQAANIQLRFLWQPFLVQSQIVAILVTAQFQLNSWTSQKFAKISPDMLLAYVLLFAVANLMIVLAGDRLARQAGATSRAWYMGIAALASNIVHALALAPDAYLQAFADGILFALVLVPTLIGTATGFLMHKSLGYSSEGDDPAALEQAASGEPEGVVLSTAEAEYYDGPLQIRSCNMAAFLSSLVGAALYVFITLIGLTDGLLPADAVHPLMRGNPILASLYAICGLAIPFYVFVKRSHAFLQKRQKTEIKSYALAGLIVPLGFGLAFIALMGPFGLIFVFPWILPSVAAMAAYHHFAGFEPLALPDDIEVKDRRTLVGRDHVRRKVRRVINVD